MTIRVLSSLLFATYFIEAGVVLVVTPWSGFWDRNYFAHVVPVVGEILRSSAMRGAVTGVGVLTVAAGLAELGGLLSRNRVEEGGTSPDRVT